MGRDATCPWQPAIKWRYAGWVKSQTISTRTSSPNKAFHQRKKRTNKGWLDETRLDIDSLPEIRLLVQSDLLTPDESNDELKNSHLIDSIPAKILIENTSYDILLESSLLNTANAQLSIRFKLDAKTWVDSQKKTANSSNKYIDIRIFVVLKP